MAHTAVLYIFALHFTVTISQSTSGQFQLQYGNALHDCNYFNKHELEKDKLFTLWNNNTFTETCTCQIEPKHTHLIDPPAIQFYPPKYDGTQGNAEGYPYSKWKAFGDKRQLTIKIIPPIEGSSQEARIRIEAIETNRYTFNQPHWFQLRKGSDITMTCVSSAPSQPGDTTPNRETTKLTTTTTATTSTTGTTSTPSSSEIKTTMSANTLRKTGHDNIITETTRNTTDQSPSAHCSNRNYFLFAVVGLIIVLMIAVVEAVVLCIVCRRRCAHACRKSNKDGATDNNTANYAVRITPIGENVTDHVMNADEPPVEQSYMALLAKKSPDQKERDQDADGDDAQPTYTDLSFN